MLFPKRICRFVILENQSEYLVDAFFVQGFLCKGKQMSCNPHTPIIRMYAQVMHDSPASVMTGQDHADDPPVLHSGKACIWISFQISCDSVPGIINGIQCPSALFCRAPQRVQGIIIIWNGMKTIRSRPSIGPFLSSRYRWKKDSRSLTAARLSAVLEEPRFYRKEYSLFFSVGLLESANLSKRER